MRILVALFALVLATSFADARNPRGGARLGSGGTGACSSGPATTAGVWVNISPPASGYAATFGIAEMEFDPNNHAVLYALVDQGGLWKSADCGATWALMGTPPAVAASSGNGFTTPFLDSPIELRIDPADSTHLVATQGVRGVSLGLWESHNGGATWTWPTGFRTISASTTTNDVTQIAFDPTDFTHYLVVSHSPWPCCSNAGIMETHDGGVTFVAHPPVPSWSAGSLAINFLFDPASGQGNANTYLVGDGVNAGMWKTTDDGSTFTEVTTLPAAHGGGLLWYASDGTIYAGSTPFPVFSHDNGNTWAAVNGTGLSNSFYYAVVGDGRALYTFQSSPILGGFITTCFRTTPQSTGTTSPWTNYQGCAQTFSNGPFVERYDAANGLMYSANWNAGLLVLKVLP